MRSIEICFSDDAIRRGEIDERHASMLELNALVRKLFGLGRIPLTLSCTIEGVTSPLKTDGDLQYALDMTPEDETLIIRAKSSIPAAELRKFFDAAPPQKPASPKTSPDPAPAPAPQQSQAWQAAVKDDDDDDEFVHLVDDVPPSVSATGNTVVTEAKEETAAPVSTEPSSSSQSTTEAVNVVPVADAAAPAPAAAAEVPPAAPVVDGGHGVDLVSVMRMMMADPQLSSMIEAMVDHVLSAPREGNPLGQALDDAVGIVQTHSEDSAAVAAAENVEDPEPKPVSEKSLSELANEIAQFELSASVLTGQRASKDDNAANAAQGDDELTDSLTDSFAEIKIPGGPSNSESPQPAAPAAAPAAPVAVAMEEQPDDIPPYPENDDDSDDEFVQVSKKDPNVPEQPEMFQQPPASRGIFSDIVGLFGRPQNSASAPIRVDRNAIELQKELREMGFKVSTPRVAQLLAQYKTREAVVNHLLNSRQG